MRLMLSIVLSICNLIIIANAAAPIFTYPNAIKTGRYVCAATSTVTEVYVITYTGTAFTNIPTTSISIIGLSSSIVMSFNPI